MTPPCKICGANTLRWAWFEDEDEPYWWWYCLECDRAGREPCIQVFAKLHVDSTQQQREQNADQRE